MDRQVTLTPAPQKPSRKTRVLHYAGVFFAGIMLWAAFPELNWWFLSYIAIAILVGVLDHVGMLRATWYGLCFGLAFFIPHLEWAYTASKMVGAWLALAGIESLFIAVFGGLFAATRVWPWARTWWGEALIAAILWVAVEELRSRIPFGGFPWGKLAYGQVDSPLVSLAPYGGEALVGFVTVVIAVLAWKTFLWGDLAVPRWRFRAVSGSLALLLLVLPALSRLENAQENGSLTVALVQGNVEIPSEETFAISHQVTGNHAQETIEFAETLTARVDLVVWGENSLDLDPREDTETAELVQQAVDAIDAPTLVGWVEFAEDSRYNWISFWYPNGQENHAAGLDETKYGKQHPVPWGEYVPLREFTEKLSPAITKKIGVDMVPVENEGYLEVTLQDGREIHVAVGICFEVAYESIMAQGVNAGGQLIVVPTNNSQFEYSSESAQQLQILRFRAAEYSRSAIQVSTNGISGVIRPDGSIMASTNKQEAASLSWHLPLRTKITWASRLGQIPAYLFIGGGTALGLAGLAAQIAAARQRRSAAKAFGRNRRTTTGTAAAKQSSAGKRKSQPSKSGRSPNSKAGSSTKAKTRSSGGSKPKAKRSAPKTN